MKKLEWDKDELLFLEGDSVIFRVSCGEVLGFSCEFPWEIKALETVAVSRAKNGIEITGVSPCKRVFGRALFEIKEQQIRLSLRFENRSPEAVPYSVFKAGLRLKGIHEGNVTIPHNIYNDNPSADPARIVPHIGKAEGGGLLVEEHRLPIPGVNAEWEESGESRYVTLFSVPAIRDGEDSEYWSLGVMREGGLHLMSLSGPTLFNGVKDMVYAGKNAFIPFERGYKNLEPGEAYEKEFLIDFGFTEKGRGFRSLVQKGWELYRPESRPALSLNTLILLKSNCLDTRYHMDGEAKGYLTFGSANAFGNRSGRPDYFLYGWTGEALKLAWCDMMLGLSSNCSQRMDKAVATVAFYLENGENEKRPGMRCGYYLVGEKAWRGGGWDDKEYFSSRIQGEALYDSLDFLLLMRKLGLAVPPPWEEAIKRGLSFVMSADSQNSKGLYPLLWNSLGQPVGDDVNSAGISCIIALLKAYTYFGEDSYLDYAKLKLALYYDCQVKDFAYPFSRATMDARCEDKEAGMFFFLAAYEMFKITGDAVYREWAEVSADWILTFVYFWETGFKKDSYYRQKAFKTTGWPGVSVQNHHLDVFFPCYEMYDFGLITNNPLYIHMGKTVFNAFSHGICTQKGEWGFDVLGEQTEQFYQTNFFMSNYPDLLYWVKEWRRGIRLWNPSWIIAQVLKPAVEFREIGVRTKEG